MKYQTIENLSWQDDRSKRRGEWTIELKSLPPQKIAFPAEPGAMRTERTKAEKKQRPFFVEEKENGTYTLISREARFREAIRTDPEEVPCAILRKRPIQSEEKKVEEIEATKAEAAENQKKEKGILRDITPFLNTISRSAAFLECAGLKVETVLRDGSEKMEINIVITKEKKNAPPTRESKEEKDVI